MTVIEWPELLFLMRGFEVSCKNLKDLQEDVNKLISGLLLRTRYQHDLDHDPLYSFRERRYILSTQ